MQQPEQVTAIYDNGGKTLDRYTFVTERLDGTMFECLGTSEYGGGFSQWSECQLGKHLGRKVNWERLSPELQQHVIARMKG